MADTRTAPPKFGDTDHDLLLKISTALQSRAGIVDGGDIRTNPALQADSKNTLLIKAAHAAQQL